jgi:hypothetical protein
MPKPSGYEDLSIKHGVGSCTDKKDHIFSGWHKLANAGKQQVCEDLCSFYDACVGYEYLYSTENGKCALRFDEANKIIDSGNLASDGFSEWHSRAGGGSAVVDTDEWATARCHKKLYASSTTPPVPQKTFKPFKPDQDVSTTAKTPDKSFSPGETTTTTTKGTAPDVEDCSCATATTTTTLVDSGYRLSIVNALVEVAVSPARQQVGKLRNGVCVC